MHSFKDHAGRLWVVAINVAQVKKVRGLLAVDLYRLLDDQLKPLSMLLMDPCKLVDVLYVLCMDQAGQLKVSDEDFGRAMFGDVIEAAAEAFVEELLDFFPDQRARLTLRKARAKSREVAGLMMQEAGRRIDDLDPADQARRLMASSPSDSSGSAPESSASTPDPIP